MSNIETSVKNYTSEQLINKVKSLPSFDKKRGLPKNLIIGVYL